MRLLGIETSCDETAAAIVEGSIARDGTPEGQILSNIVLSQTDHEAFGGVVPEIAARAHVMAIDSVITAAMTEADCAYSELDALAVSSGPGLIGGLIVGLMAAKSIALAHDLPFLGINHLEGHALTARLSDQLPYPYLLLLVSGGHSQILLVSGLGQYHRLGSTIDDALGEAFDKTAKLLGLGYPGGPAVERAALVGDPDRFSFPMPLRGKMPPNFSFSGLKTAVRQQAEALVGKGTLSDEDVADICASFQKTVAAIIEDRLLRAFDLATGRSDVKQMLQGASLPLVVAGGVAANKVLRASLADLADRLGTTLVAPPLRLCGDNGAMIAWAGLERFAAGETHDFTLAPRARWPLDMNAQTMIGHGKAGPKV
jgi:N6-L-threonylcarbamoyladenine synthase